MAGRKVFTREVLASADVQSYLMDQEVIRFPSASVRNVEWPAPPVNALSILDTNGYIERYAGSSAGWVPLSTGFARAHVRQTSTNPSGQGSGVYAALTFQAAGIEKDTHGGFTWRTTPGTGTRWTCPLGQAGSYLVSGLAQFGAAVQCASRLMKNGALVGGGQHVNTGANTQMGPILVDLAEGDFVELQATVAAPSWNTVIDPILGPSRFTVVRVS